MKRVLLLSIFLPALPCAARAVTFKPQLSTTSGNQGYAGISGSLKIGFPGASKDDGVLSVKPGFTQYRSDLSSGTYKTGTLRVAYDKDMWGVGLTASRTPAVNEYSNRSFGGDVQLTLDPTGTKEDEGWLRFDLGAGLTFTTHTDQFQALPSTSTARRVSRRARAVDIRQRDADVSAGATVFDVSLSARYTASRYDKNLAAISARSAQVVRLAGVNSLVQGFPDKSLNARLDVDLLPVVSPYLSCTRTTFQLGLPDAQVATAGLSLSFFHAVLDAAYERTRQQGLPDLKTLTFSGGVKF